MEKICLVQGGDFLLGIAAQDIVSQISLIEADPTAPKFHLGALLARQAAPLGQAKAPCLQVQGGEESIYLHVEKILDTIEPTNFFSPPPACPQLFTQVCPRLTLWQDTLVFLLEPRQIIPVWEALGGQEMGRITILPPPASEPFSQETLEAPEEAAPLLLSVETFRPEEPELFVHDVHEEQESLSENVEEAQVEEKSSIEPAQEEETEEQSTEQQAEEAQAIIDEATFKQVMDWTVMQFKQTQGGKDQNFGLEHLPPELATSIEAKGLKKNIIQYLIDQIVLRCQEKSSLQKRHAG
jgi:hypothetical protein